MSLRERFARYNLTDEPKPEPVIEPVEVIEEEESSLSTSISETLSVETPEPPKEIIPNIVESDVDPREIHPMLPKTQIYNEILKVHNKRKQSNQSKKKLKLGRRKLKEPDIRRQKLEKIIPRIRNIKREGIEFKTEEDPKEDQVQIKGNLLRILDCVMNRVGDKSMKKQILKSMFANRESHFVLLLSEPMRTIEGLYQLCDGQIHKLWGSTPEQIENIVRFWSFNTSKKDFSAQKLQCFSNDTDAVSMLL